MKIGNTDNKRKIIIAGIAGVATILLAVGMYQQSIASITTPNTILIDFTAFPERDQIEISKGEILTIPIIVESPREANYDLKISVYPDRISGNPVENGPIGNLTTAGLVLQLDKQLIALSSANAVLRELPGDRVERDSGSVLTVIATPETAEGTYSYILETRREMQNGEAMGTNYVFTITVK